MVRDSAVIVTWNGQQVYKVLPSQSGSKIRFRVHTTKGCHQLGFCPAGCLSESYHKTEIRNVAIYEKQCVAAWGTDLITNGGFEQNSCGGSFCIWNQNTIQANSVPGWIPSP